MGNPRLPIACPRANGYEVDESLMSHRTYDLHCWHRRSILMPPTWIAMIAMAAHCCYADGLKRNAPCFWVE